MKHFRSIILLATCAIGLATLVILTSSNAQSMIHQQSNFDFAIHVVMQHEGGLTNSKGDPGGETNWGISLRFIKDEHICENGDCKGDANEVIHLTQTEADQIYYFNWWKKFHYDKIKDKFVATKIMDFSINAGSSRAHRIAKQALNSIHGKFFVVNGELDDRSIALINATEPAVMMDALRAEEAKFYRDIVKRNPSLRPFEKGWLKRSQW